jgi:hypothetical protein
LDKNAYFQGETVTGVVLGRYDGNTKPTSFRLGKIVNGQAVISMTAGGVRQKLLDSFLFLKMVTSKFTGKYVVVPN